MFTAHTTHETQPLDCAVFSPLKAQWRKIAHEFLQSNPGQVITKFNFNSLFAKAWMAAITPANLVAGFKTCDLIAQLLQFQEMNQSQLMKRILVKFQLWKLMVVVPRKPV